VRDRGPSLQEKTKNISIFIRKCSAEGIEIMMPKVTYNLEGYMAVNTEDL
jgi:hypothetical protein